MNKYISDYQVKKDICEIGKRMYDRDFTAANDGNISIRVGENEIWTTPTGVSKGFMDSSMMVKVNLEGKVLEGSLKPSSELKMHLKVYMDRPDVMSVTHAHPPIATSFAVAGIPLDRALLPEAIINLGSVPIARYATPSTQEIPDSIAEFTKDYEAVLLANHGVLTWGKDVYEAFFKMETVEHYAKINLYTTMLGKANELSRDNIERLLEIKRSMKK